MDTELKVRELTELYKRQLMLDALDKDIDQERDEKELISKLQLSREFSKEQIKLLLESLQDNIQCSTDFANEVKKIVGECSEVNKDMANQLKAERRENNEAFMNIFRRLILDPEETLGMALRVLSEQQSLKDQQEEKEGS